MREGDEVAVANERHWQRMVREKCGYTVPWLDLDPELIRLYARRQTDLVPDPAEVALACSFNWIVDVEGKDILCLALGGGQQSAVFGLLGARVTVADLAHGQLDGDSRAAAHYGYKVTLLHADMRDLSCLDDASFDVVYGTALCYIPDVSEVYAEVARVLRPGGIYRTDFHQPAIHFVNWDGSGYRITKPYIERVDRREDGAIEFRHYMDDLFNGLVDAGLSIYRVLDLSRSVSPDARAPLESYTRLAAYIGGQCVVVATKGTRPF